MPRPNTPVIHPGWSAHHRPTVERTWTAECTIRRPGGTRGEFDPTTGTYPTVPHEPHHSGACRVQVLGTAEQERITAEQGVTAVGYLVVVDQAAATTTRIDDLVEITAVDDNGGQDLVGRAMPVESIVRGSLTWELDLTCVDYLEGGA